jgi:F0F1-type ATP synthase membrane subunit b/b'
MSIPALATLTTGQRIAGAALGIALWLLPALGVWLYMAAKADAAEELGKATAQAECAERQTEALATAIKEAREEWVKTQKGIDDRAERDAREIARFLADARRSAARISKDMQAHAQANPLSPGCRADPERVRMWNQSRRGDPPEG